MRQSFASASHIYNHLSSVFESDARLEALGRRKTIDSLLSVISDYGLEQHVGIVLLHKHNEIYDGEMMVENLEIDDAGPALITRARHVHSISRPACPNSWQWSAGDFHACEFSYENLLSSSTINPSHEPEFFFRFGQALCDLQATELLGANVNVSTYVEGLRPSEDALLLESTALDERANVLRYVEPHTMDLPSFVETAWFATKPGNDSPKSPDKSKPKPQGCRRICPSVQNPPVHQGTYIHQRT